jgi:hypothetical protein
LQFSFAVIGRHRRLSEQLLESLAAAKAGTSFLKRLAGRISELASDFKKASRNFIFNFSAKWQPNIAKTVNADAKVLI